MTHAGYVFAGWGLGLGVIGLYAWSVIRRGRALSRHVPPRSTSVDDQRRRSRHRHRPDRRGDHPVMTDTRPLDLTPREVRAPRRGGGWLPWLVLAIDGRARSRCCCGCS